MTYPKRSPHGVTSDGAARVPASPRFPEIEQGILAFWKGDNTFQASIARDARSGSFTTARPSPTAFRTTATC
jgi:isoleucyl-tRNA synthetase